MVDHQPAIKHASRWLGTSVTEAAGTRLQSTVLFHLNDSL